MMVQEVWHAAASTIKAALWTISTLEFWNATAAIISTLLAYACIDIARSFAICSDRESPCFLLRAF
jgi:hypothetical protein